MSLDAMDWVWTNSQSKGVARLVMLAIADKVVGEDCKAYAGLTFLQDRANAGRSTVIGALRELADSGELEAMEGETGRFGAAVYRLPKALGHVRGEGLPRHRSVQHRDRSGKQVASQNGAEAAPNQDASEDESNSGQQPGAPSGKAQIGAEAALNEHADTAQNDAASALIPGNADASTSAETAPDQEWHQGEIGAEAGLGSVQILDPTGAGSAPQNQEQKKNQRTRSRAAASPSKPRRTREYTDAPDAFEVTEELAEWARTEHKVSRALAVSQTEVFLNHNRANGKQYANWTAAWKNWIARIPQFSPNLLRSANGAQGPGPYRNDPDKDYGRGFPGVVTTYENEGA